MIRGEFDGARDGVDCPAENGFAGGPASITFLEFLGGDWFFAEGTVSG
jgi:hypothetical protein